ncbi:hypothetical protein SEA_IZZY_51 [Streptomyces phage Izzy]|uniref:Uncharacterized protein n=6 Tax=Likavirus izzy TaxID=1982888 RepID=A0A2U8UTM5_9CAUD|nr:hypothetical protein AVT27_gp51 [Streptomyces phage Izzy]ATE85004.1 hypothetical protein SEA_BRYANRECYCLES_51 [Streptomyces phage BryanRecycles]ATE85305.1 hypothetical protein SEA_JASH_51 [Streptomyces phage Jash]ATE85381.1 hypothetical protein SEA_OLIYNYK_51 [Streptomyces phage Oliynyk]AWN07494.1 hypothetical protein SEA_EDDASA_51 [Streptomyces phage Eddasa]QDK03982.1 hypothetical protein SEA_RUSTICUS_51 [Streptomyces phage Rusticus]
MTYERPSRPHQLIERYPKLFDTEREEKLPVWARAKLADLRLLLMREAGENDHLREEISRVYGEERVE